MPEPSKLLDGVLGDVKTGLGVVRKAGSLAFFGLLLLPITAEVVSGQPVASAPAPAAAPSFLDHTTLSLIIAAVIFALGKAGETALVWWTKFLEVKAKSQVGMLEAAEVRRKEAEEKASRYYADLLEARQAKDQMRGDLENSRRDIDYWKHQYEDVRDENRMLTQRLAHPDPVQRADRDGPVRVAVTNLPLPTAPIGADSRPAAIEDTKA